ncbi:hypothetical protein MKK88_30835 [Methylobacterium sp. E-005]|uniref:hypothetical protein n=1 Tax=Methylobacterium sp. E-005 TaxID=2836549 RepID=UPI001FBBC114|nr:hypothetical protein [Methylobacterium sp. E-005]MCJ2090349.1 hypothetical protein [Methylobacterium sp. E-005]
MRHDSPRTTTAVAQALGRPADLTAAIGLLDALHDAGYSVVRHAPLLTDPAASIIAGEIVSGGRLPATEVATRIIGKLAQAGLAPGAGQPTGRTVPLTIAGVPLVALISTTEATALAAALAQGRTA